MHDAKKMTHNDIKKEETEEKISIFFFLLST